MSFETLYAKYRAGLEDFWGRRESRPRFSRQVYLFGRRLSVCSNHQGALAAIDYCVPLYSRAPPTEHGPFHIQLVVQAVSEDLAAVPDDLFDYIQYAGHADWLTMQLGPWGHCYADLAQGRAVAVLTQQLARRPEMISRCLLNTIITNLFIASGFAMLHASCLYREGRALLLMAAHNTGKSTTALRLALAGYPLLSDSMIFLSPDGEELLILGFPVGRIKLRQDVLAEFPRIQPFLMTEPVRGETKYSLDLRQFDGTLVEENAAFPSDVDLCLLARSSEVDSHLEVVTRAEVMEAVMVNSLFYDSEDIWRRNLQEIQRLLDRAQYYRLIIGTDGPGVVDTVSRLWTASRA
jgi:hypothetical protein